MLKGIKGIYPDKYHGQINEERTKLCEQLRPYVSLLVPYIPARFNAAVGAVICKMAIKYGLDKALRFVYAINNAKFNGHNDPAYLLWMHLVKNRNTKSSSLYATVVTAARAWGEGRELKSLRQSETDLLEWSDDLIPAIESIGKELSEIKEKKVIATTT
jgi:hypothetical protein